MYPPAEDNYSTRAPSVKPSNGDTANSADDKKGTMPARTILLWTPWFKWKSWFFQCFGADCFTSKKCPVANCHVTNNRRRLNVSALVLFHARDLMTLPSFHRPEQRWLYFSLESPVNTRSPGYSDPKSLDGVFNLTMTYSRDSDIPIARRETIAANSGQSVAEKTINYADGKNRMALWMASNCRSKKRNALVKTLRTYLSVDIFGRCGEQDPCSPKEKHHLNYTSCDQELFSKYKFYMALENSQCREYITDKFWKGLINGMLPVVMGPPIQDYERVAPPNSFLHVDNFTSVEALADYMTYLDNHDSAYNRYFEWHKHYQINQDFILTSLCKVCELANEDVNTLPRKTYEISQWWNRKALCH